LSPDHAKLILDAGADCITLGDHAFDQKDMLSFIDKEPRIIRPINYSKQAPGVGARLFEAPAGRKVLVAQILGQVFMKRPFDDPFSAIDEELRKTPLKGRADAIIVDTHAEATSTAYHTDAGMCGVYNSVIGMDKEEPLQRFITGMRKARFTPAEGEATLCGTYVETDNTTGLAKKVMAFRAGGSLKEERPE